MRIFMNRREKIRINKRKKKKAFIKDIFAFIYF